jgi:thiol-disulfide isomerase/thioredoxin
MALTPSTMMPLGTQAPDFALLDTISGKTLSLQQLKGSKGTLVMFICNHCPYVKHIKDALAKLGKDYQNSSISIIAINANDAQNYPDDAPDKMTVFAKQNGFVFPYLHDESQNVAKSYGAACTPDLFLFDGNLKCVYRGQFDDSRPGNNIPVTGKDLRTAMDQLIAGKSIDSKQTPSIGCNIKWKA